MYVQYVCTLYCMYGRLRQVRTSGSFATLLQSFSTTFRSVFAVINSAITIMTPTQHLSDTGGNNNITNINNNNNNNINNNNNNNNSPFIFTSLTECSICVLIEYSVHLIDVLRPIIDQVDRLLTHRALFIDNVKRERNEFMFTVGTFGEHVRFWQSLVGDCND